MFSFLSDTQTLVFTIYAAILGIAFPLLLQIIDRIGVKYNSDRLSGLFMQENEYQWFRFLLFISSICVLLSPIVLGVTNDESIHYWVIMSLLITISSLVMSLAFLVRLVRIYYAPSRLVKHVGRKFSNDDLMLVYELILYADKIKDVVMYREVLSLLHSSFYEKQRTVKGEEEAVEYSEEQKEILRRIAIVVGENNTSLLSSQNNITSILLPIISIGNRTYVSFSTYVILWYMLDRAAASGNDTWLKTYWVDANQYFDMGLSFPPNNSEESYLRFYKAKKYFYHFNVMFGALLIYHKEYSMLSHIMSFSRSTVYKYPLIPGTFSQIIDMMIYIDSLLERPLEIRKRYYIDINRGVDGDKEMAKLAYIYLALLFVRIWSYDDYNISFKDPFETPKVSNVDIDENETRIRLSNLLKRYVNYWYSRSEVLEKMQFRKLPKEDEVYEKINSYISMLKEKNERLERVLGIDEKKLQKIYDELVCENSEQDIGYFTDKSKILVNKLDCCETTTIHAETQIEQIFLQQGRIQELGNVGSSLAYMLFADFYEGYFVHLQSKFYLQIKSITHYELEQKLKEFDPDDVCIFASGLMSDIALENHLDFVEIPCLPYGVVWIISKSDLPIVEIIDFPDPKEGMVKIDPYNHLYASVDVMSSKDYKINVEQAIRVCYPSDMHKTKVFKYYVKGNSPKTGV